MDLGISLGSKRKTKFQDPVKNKRFTWHNGSCVNNEADKCQEDCMMKETCFCHESFNEPGNGDFNSINRNDNCTKSAFDQNYPGSFEAASNMANFTEIPALDSSEIIQFNGCNSKEFVGIQELRLTCPIGIEEQACSLMDCKVIAHFFPWVWSIVISQLQGWETSFMP